MPKKLELQNITFRSHLHCPKFKLGQCSCDICYGGIAHTESVKIFRHKATFYCLNEVLNPNLRLPFASSELRALHSLKLPIIFTHGFMPNF